MELNINGSIAVAGTTGWSLSIPAADTPAERTAALVALCDAVARHGGGRVEFWVEDSSVDDEAWVAPSGLQRYRDLLILRVGLPIDAEVVETRPFTDADADQFLRVNNRAFSWHPEQSGMTHADLADRMAEPWFDADGFRLYEVGDALAGFCWTKIHAELEPPEGEIFVIGIDPDYHGRGLGKPLTAAGLDWLASKGLTVGILYVESDNHAAIRTYEKLGFERYRVNRAFERLVEPT